MELRRVIFRSLNIKITGKVKGVLFRDSTKAVANQLGITGFVRNEPDGSVYAEAEGTSLKLNNFVEWCREGPDRAEVSDVQVTENDHLQDFRDFVVRKKDIFGPK